MSLNRDDVSLGERAFTALPLGQIRPAGWLLTQLRIQADGLTGHLDEFWPDVANSAWIGGSAEGWERGPYWLDGLIPLAFLLDDERLKAKARHWVDYILSNQHEDGWLGAVNDLKISNSRDLKGRARHSYQQDPWPRFILLKALTQYHDATGDERVISAMQRFLKRLDELTEQQPLRSWARYRWADLLVSVYWLFEHTHEPWLLTFAAKIHDQGFDWRTHFERFPYRDKSLREEQDLTTHVVNNAMAVKAPGVWHLQSCDPADRDAVALIISELDRYHGQATGVFSGDEHLAGRNPSQGTELCAVVEYMYSLEQLVMILGDSLLADRLESLAYNALPATISPDMWAHQYVQQVNQVVCSVSEDRIYTSNGPDANIFGLEPHFGCCTANMHQGWPKFVSHLWMKSADGGLAAVAYGPCSVETDVDGTEVRVDVTTDYPFDGTIRITVDVNGSADFPIYLRIPDWATSAQLQIGTGRNPDHPDPNTFHRVDGHWSGITELILRLPMKPRFEWRDVASVSVYRGPLLLALPIGEDWQKIGGTDPHADWEVHPTTAWNYALVLQESSLEDAVQVNTHPLSSAPFTPETAPVAVSVEARQIPEWVLEHNAAAVVPESPVSSQEPKKTLTLVPYGATNLRIGQFPVAGE